MKIENTGSVTDLDIKRCYLPIIITSTCPTCGAAISKHLEGDYISYPKVNKPFDISMWHHIENDEDKTEEEHAWKVTVILRVTMEPVS